MSKPAAALAMSESQREVQRAPILLLAADGATNARIATEAGLAPVTVRVWPTGPTPIASDPHEAL
jgi:hypothetical protein